MEYFLETKTEREICKGMQHVKAASKEGETRLAFHQKWNHLLVLKFREVRG